MSRWQSDELAPACRYSVGRPIRGAILGLILEGLTLLAIAVLAVVGMWVWEAW